MHKKIIMVTAILLCYKLPASEQAIAQADIRRNIINSGLTPAENGLNIDELLSVAGNFCNIDDVDNGYRILKAIEYIRMNNRQSARMDLIYAHLYYKEKRYSAAYQKFSSVILNQFSSREDFAESCIYMGDIFFLGQEVDVNYEEAKGSYMMVLAIDSSAVSIAHYKNLAQRKIDETDKKLEILRR